MPSKKYTALKFLYQLSISNHIIMKLLFISILCLLNFSFIQKRDSALYPDPVLVPDTQRMPPTKIHREDTADVKMKGGALIDTITPNRSKRDSL